jgi:hypothetical protein
VRLTTTVGGPTGDDLRFIAADQRTILPHQLDKRDAAGSLVWVRFPDVQITGPAPAFWVYYGNPAAPSTSSGAAVFADRYVSVHHLGVDLGDATGRGHAADAPTGQTPSVMAGRIGDARDFDGQNDHLDLPNEQDFDFTTQLSVSAWIRRQTFDSAYQAIVTKGDKAWRLHRENATAFAGFGTTAAGQNRNQGGDMTIDDGNWHHVAIVFGAATKQIFVDGQLDQADTGEPPIDASNVAVSLGYNSEAVNPPARFWNGALDEVRISGAARDRHWMFAEHHTVVAAGFAGVGGEETSPR